MASKISSTDVLSKKEASKVPQKASKLVVQDLEGETGQTKVEGSKMKGKGTRGRPKNENKVSSTNETGVKGSPVPSVPQVVIVLEMQTMC
jgi:hypothetical protein